jgi:hypothetical protein
MIGEKREKREREREERERENRHTYFSLETGSRSPAFTFCVERIRVRTRVRRTGQRTTKSI